MRIVDVEALHLRIPDIAEVADGTQDVLLVRVTSDSGLQGIGEVSSCPHRPTSARPSSRPRGLRSAGTGCGRSSWAINSTPSPISRRSGRRWATIYHQTNRYGRRGAAVHAISGVDLALWDLILGKHEGRPVYELLGGLVCPRVRAYASMLFGATPEATAALARGARADGLTACKFGWGPFGADPAVDIAHVRAARDALGPDIELMVDAGCK
jgi:L-rhamnonate dehydratase